MKIVLFTDAWPPQVNGIVTHILNTLPLLAKNHELHICTFASGASIDVPRGVQVHTAPSAPLPIYPEVRATSVWSQKFARVVAEVQPDVIHVHTPLTIGAAGTWLARRKGIPLVMTFHTYFAEPEYLKAAGLTFMNMHENVRLQDIMWKLLGMLYNKADIIISPSRTTTRDIQKRFDAHIRYETVFPGVVAGKFKRPTLTESDMRQAYGIHNDYIVYVGRLSKEKNIDELISAYHASNVWQGPQPCDLVIAGSGPAEEDLHRMAEKSGIGSHIVFTGRIPHTDLQKSGLYKRAKAFVSASTSETYGLTYAEAMSAGLPIIAARAKAAVELLSGNGIMCPPHDVHAFAHAIKKLVHNSVARQDMGKRSLEIVQEQSIEKTVTKLEKLYKAAVKL